MKKILILAAVLMLTACEPTTSDKTSTFALPDHLKDCTITNLSSTSAARLTVVRCPNSSVSASYPVGKTQQTTIVIDGQTYAKVEK